jgi:hypothetical protein
MTWLYSVIAGLLIAVLYACATWMGFQCHKQGTLLPCGLIPERYGVLISMLSYGICGIALIVSGFLLGWWVAITIGVTWFVGGRLAIHVERLFYARDRLEAFPYHAQRMREQYGEDRAIEAWNMAVPRWWLNLMSWRSIMLFSALVPRDIDTCWMKLLVTISKHVSSWTLTFTHQPEISRSRSVRMIRSRTQATV